MSNVVAAQTSRSLIESVVRSVCGREATMLTRLTSGGLNETYRVELSGGEPVIIRIARRSVPWFVDEEYAMTQARAVGVPTPEVLGLQHVELDGLLLSFSIQRMVSGRSLDERASELRIEEIDRLVVCAGDLLARLNSVKADRGVRHELKPPDEEAVERAARAAHRALGSSAIKIVERGAEFLRDAVATRPVPRSVLSHGDWLPKHLFVDDSGSISGVIDWEFTGPAPAARDLARWEVAAGDLYDRSDLLRLGYSRVAEPDRAEAEWAPAFAVDFALEILCWINPAPPHRLQHCVSVIEHAVGG